MRRASASLLLMLALPLLAQAEDLVASASLARGRVLVQGSIEGVGPYPFLLDTCIAQGILHEGVDEYLSLPRLQETGEKLPLVEADPFSLGPLGAQSQTFLVADLTPLAERLGTPIGGILPAHQPGLELTVDFPAGEVRWRALDEAELLDKTVPGALPLRFDDTGAPQLQVLLNGSHLVPLRVDLAYGGVLALPESLLKELGLEPREELLTQFPQGREGRQVMIDSAAAGAARLRQCLCEVTAPEEAPRLGLGFLRHFRLTMNFENGLAKLQRDEGLDLIAPAVVGTGIVPAAVQDEAWRIGVVQHSPAARAGLTPEDQLLQVNGKRAAAMAPAVLQAALNGRHGETVLVLVRQGNDQREFTVPCETLLAK